METYIDAPIRIHKYNVDEDDSNDSNDPSNVEQAITMLQADSGEQPSRRQLDDGWIYFSGSNFFFHFN